MAHPASYTTLTDVTVADFLSGTSEPRGVSKSRTFWGYLA